MKRRIAVLGMALVGAALMNSALVQAQPVEIAVTLPEIPNNSYRPYVSVWIEDANDDVVATLAVWSKEPDWLKDMRRWWRKAGRYDQGDLDSVSGATRKPGRYSLSWNGMDAAGNAVAPGTYVVNVEAAREHGGRSLVRQEITLNDEEQHLITAPQEELGEIEISVKSKSGE
ncbi:DUF2271 domain-containing protein [Nitrincola sp. MINF-07-Sa-05]|uniref:DUF2271 domain-containing protein n=1 Tax=Nitrincola salilacus TaxID=3400273 RepID=UPI003918450A